MTGQARWGKGGKRSCLNRKKLYRPKNDETFEREPEEIMSSVFVIISETMPVNGTYPASAIEAFYPDEPAAWTALDGLAWTTSEISLDRDQTVFYAEVDPEKFEYIEYRIEEHTIKQ